MTRSRIQDSEREEVGEFVEYHWHSQVVMSRGRSFYPHQEEGFVERRDDRIAGLLTFHVDQDELEVLTLNSVLEGAGIGLSLMLDAIEEARTRGCHRIWLTTTNDKVRSLRYYQRLGFRMVAVNPGVVDEARKIKPQIPEVGQDGIAIHDEIVLELRIKPYLDEADTQGSV